MKIFFFKCLGNYINYVDGCISIRYIVLMFVYYYKYVIEFSYKMLNLMSC